MKLLCIFTLFFLIITGCSFIPEYVPSKAPVSNEFNIDDLKISDNASEAAFISYKDFFTDPDFVKILEIALKNNRDLLTAINRIEEARATYGIARADLFPNISGNLSGGRSRTPEDLSVSGQATTSSQYNAAFNLTTWEIDFWGRLRSLKESALNYFLSSEQAKKAVELSLVKELAVNYIVIRELDERILIAESSLRTRSESYRIMKLRYEVGAISKLEYTQAEILLNQAKTELAILMRQREQSINAITLLIGVQDVKISEKPLSQIEDKFSKDIKPGLPSSLLLNRPDILAAEFELKAANANIGAARAAFFPNITLTAAYGSGSDELDSLLGNNNSAWNFAANINLPIFQGGRNIANLARAKAQFNVALTIYEKTIQTAFKEVADALSDLRWLAKQLDIEKKNLATLVERTRLANLRYESGAASYLEVLDAEREQFTAEQTVVQTRRALLASSVNLYTALGGGSLTDSYNISQRKISQGE